MAQAITLTLSEQEAQLTLQAVRSSSSMMSRDFRHADDQVVLDRIAIQLEAHLKMARSGSYR